VEVLCDTKSEVVWKELGGKVVESGGPEIYTYHQLMEFVLKYSNRSRPIISIPFSLGRLQAAILEKLPPNLFTLTRGQIEQLKMDNVVNPRLPENHTTLERVLQRFAEKKLTSMHEILPQYL